MWPYLLAFLSSFCADFAWCKYVTMAAEKEAVPTAVWGSSLVVLSGIGVLSYTHSHWALIPAACGAFLGSYIAIRRESK